MMVGEAVRFRKFMFAFNEVKSGSTQVIFHLESSQFYPRHMCYLVLSSNCDLFQIHK